MQRSDTRALLIAAGIGLIGIGVIAPLTRAHHSPDVEAAGSAPTDASTTTSTMMVSDTSVPDSIASTDPTTTTVVDSVPDVGGDDEEGCYITERSLRGGSTGPSVNCLQEALKAHGYYGGSISGFYDTATANAVRALQKEKDLFVDGVAGRETGIALGIWPDEASLVVHTPAPAPGAKDSMGFALSSVASTGADVPPLPENSGEGRRVVYSRAGQRVWAIGENGVVVRSWLVSGSKYNNETPGTHTVYSRSEVSTAWNGKAYLKKMIRWLKTQIGAIGFHSIPIHVSDGSAYMTEAELGQRLSGGCQRQAPLDAAFMWSFAQIGTKVVVI